MIIQVESDEELVDAWLALKNSAKTKEQYSYQVITGLNGMGKSIKEITIDDALNYDHKLEKQKLALATRALRFNALKSLFKFAHAVGYIPENHLAVFTFKPKESDKKRMLEDARKDLKKKFLTPEQVEQMIDTETNPKHRLIIRTLYLSAARVSEILPLTWADLVPNEKDDGGRIILMAKGQRVVTPSLPAPLFQELLAMKGKPDKYVFAKNDGSQMTRQAVWWIVKKAAKRIGAKWTTSPHTLRHSHASHAIANGATIVQVQEQLGHASLASTSIYTHADERETSVHVLSLK